ncbi:MAG: UPF0179 family protein [Euryarchaeota archaeon]|nr:UPF0179 family protein [Euryarchaeota archaeon]
MVTITLIGEHQAKIGEMFVYRGPLTECRDCKLKAVCFNLDAGSLYRIINVRDVKHDCRMHEEGVRVVEVKKEQHASALSIRSAIEGSMITFEAIKCDELGCENWRICHPIGVENQMKFRVAKVGKELSCPAGHRMMSVMLE